ncbi:MAG: MBL fold metallo-hydrolase [Thermodesulfobacteriota bacterium]
MEIRQIEVGLMKVFCYLVSCEKTRQALVIDPGGRPEPLLAELRRQGLVARYIVNSHNHPDHTCGNRGLAAATGAAIVMHEADRDLLADAAVAQSFLRIDFPPSDSPPPDILVKDGDRLAVGSFVAQVLHTPGHSPGSICLLAQGNLFTGDTLFVGGAGRLDLPGGDFGTLMAALQRQLLPLPDDTLVWPGHDYGDTRSSTIGRERRENPFLGGDWG